MIYCLIGQSASGKSTIERMLEEMGFPRIISYTTRPERGNEINGVDYHFIDDNTFQEMDKKGFFSEIATYRDWKYGLSLRGVNYLSNDYIAVVTIHGYNEIARAVGEENVIAIHINVDERDRLVRLANRGDNVDEIIRRIHADREDFKLANEICDYIVENKSVDRTLIEVYNIIRKESAK